MIRARFFIWPLLLLSFQVMAGSDLVKEQRWANLITDFMADGDPQWLVANGKRFLSIYSPAGTPDTKGAVILIHDAGQHPDWPQVIHPLRTSLASQGWMTLSLQMPVLENDASEYEYLPLLKDVPARIDAGLAFLARYKIENVILIGYNLGSSMASNYLAKHTDERIKAFVGIGMNGRVQPNGYESLDAVNSLLQMKIPVLDIYAAKSKRPIIDSVDRRAYVIYHSNLYDSRQVQIKGAKDSFTGHEKQLVSEVSSWIDNFSSQEKVSKVDKFKR